MPQRELVPPGPVAVEAMLYEVHAQCRMANVTADSFDAARQSSDPNSSYLAWIMLHTMISAAYTISLLTGGTTEPRMTERAELRSLLAIDDGSLLHDRSIRNAIEHIDERIMSSYGARQFGSIVSRNIVPMDLIRGPQTNERLLNFDPYTGMVTFYDTPISIPQVMAEIRRVEAACGAALHLPPPSIPISQMTCAHCGNLTPQCTCVDVEGKPLQWGLQGAPSPAGE
jgi:hypothetical protein